MALDLRVKALVLALVFRGDVVKAKITASEVTTYGGIEICLLLLLLLLLLWTESERSLDVSPFLVISCMYRNILQPQE